MIVGQRLTQSLDFPDHTPTLDTYELAKSNHIVKVIDSEIFSENSDPTEFGRMLQHLWAADEVQFTAPYVPRTSCVTPSIAYTVPRTGTHVAVEVHGTNGFIHVGPWHTLQEQLLESLLQSQSIVGVARKNLSDFVCSREINKITTEVMLTTVHQYSISANTEIVKNLKPFRVDLERVIDYIDEMANYYSQLLALKIMFSKHVSFSLLEDLAVRKDLIITKNPYRYEDLIINYQDVCDLVNTKYQPAYTYMTNQVIKHCGLALSGVQYPSINDYR